MIVPRFTITHNRIEGSATHLDLRSNCADCTLERCRAKPFFDMAGNRTATGWTCTRCGNKWLVTERQAWYVRAWRWIMCPLIPKESK